MSRAFKVTIPFTGISHAEIPKGKFDVRVTADGLYLRPSQGRKRRWRFLSWEDAVISAVWSAGPPVPEPVQRAPKSPPIAVQASGAVAEAEPTELEAAVA